MKVPPSAGAIIDRSRIRRGIVVALAISAATLIGLSLLTINRDTFSALSRLSPGILLVAVSLSLGRWILSAIRLRLILKGLKRTLPFSTLMKTVYGGYFTGLVTPWRAGGITGEAVFLYLYGLPAGEAAAAISFGASISTLLLLLLFPLAIYLTNRYINLNLTFKGFMFSALGIGIAFLALVIMAMIRAGSFRAERMVERSPSFLKNKPRYVRLIEGLAKEIERFSSSLKLLFRLTIWEIVLVLFCSMAFWLLGFMVVPTVLLGLGYPRFFGHAVLAQLVIQLLMPFVPIPGGSGVGEVGFFWIYQRFLSDSGLSSILTLVWRFIDFYLGLLVGGAFFLWIMKDTSSRRPRFPSQGHVPTPGSNWASGSKTGGGE